MLREAAQNREGFGGTPRHRRHNAPQWPDESDCTKCTTKGRKERDINAKLMLMLTALAAAVIFSFAMFSSPSHPMARVSSSGAAGLSQFQQEGGSINNKQRSRKLEHGQQLESQQQELRVRQEQEVAQRAAAVGGRSGGKAAVGDRMVEGEEEWWNVEEGDDLDDQDGKRAPSPYFQALKNCTTLACVKEAARQKRYKGQFLFPHFMIIGWQKCATTSLFHHLKDHPRVLMPIEKEPEFFSYECDYSPTACPADKQKEYIEDTLHLQRVLKQNLYRAMFEGSTHYAREGMRMAKGLREVFPWVKLIASMREPISRYLSMLGHNLDKNTYTCLVKHKDLFECLELELPWNNYTMPFTSWLDAGYPPQQIMLLQYESLVSDKVADHLRNVKSFLGLDPDLPANDLPQSNTRAARLGAEPEGWPMKRWQYERLVEIVRPDAKNIADIVDKYGFGSGAEWMRNWEAAWQANLDTCEPGREGACKIH